MNQEAEDRMLERSRKAQVRLRKLAIQRITNEITDAELWEEMGDKAFTKSELFIFLYRFIGERAMPKKEEDEA